MSKMIASILYCHERNVCHRDVKLDNFVYESNGEDAELKLIDFGLSHVLLHTQVRVRVRVRVRLTVTVTLTLSLSLTLMKIGCHPGQEGP